MGILSCKPVRIIAHTGVVVEKMKEDCWTGVSLEVAAVMDWQLMTCCAQMMMIMRGHDTQVGLHRVGRTR